jgi:hypothetical protein
MEKKDAVEWGTYGREKMLKKGRAYSWHISKSKKPRR